MWLIALWDTNRATQLVTHHSLHSIAFYCSCWPNGLLFLDRFRYFHPDQPYSHHPIRCPLCFCPCACVPEAMCFPRASSSASMESICWDPLSFAIDPHDSECSAWPPVHPWTTLESRLIAVNLKVNKKDWLEETFRKFDHNWVITIKPKETYLCHRLNRNQSLALFGDWFES